MPTAAETGYGYIRADRAGRLPVDEQGAAPGHGAAVYRVAEFVEKPDLATARTYLDSGDYYWNSGMFLFRASVFLAELESWAPEILAACRLAFARRSADLDFVRVDAAAFAACPGNSIDYAVMEKTGRAAVIPLDAGWSDVGSWSALWEVGVRRRGRQCLPR